MAETLARLHGGEMEWSVFVPNADKSDGVQLDGDDLKRVLSAYISTVPHILCTSSGYFTEDGSRLYLDVGAHIETTGPESLSFVETTASEFAQERKIQAIGAVAVAQSSTLQCGPLDTFTIHKRVLADKDGNGASNLGSGCHESYLARRECFSEEGKYTANNLDDRRMALLGIHMATRTIYTGAGGLKPNGTFVVGQKASLANYDYTGGTTTRKPVVNTRNESLADSEKYARVHMTLGDANMSPWAIRMKYGTTALVIRLIENGIELPGLRFGDKLAPVTKRIATDPSLESAFALADDCGKSLTAIQVQKRLLNAAIKLSRQINLPHEEQWTIAEWERVLADLKQEPKRARDRVEWLLRFDMLERYRDRHGLTWTDELLRKKDLQWDLLGPTGLGIQLRERVWAEWMPSDQQITHAMTNPPQNTRAKIRGDFVKAYSKHPTAKASWFSVSNGRGTAYILDPFATYDARVAALIDERYGGLQKVG